MDMPPPTLKVIASAIECGRHLRAHLDDALEYQDLTWPSYLALLTMAQSGHMIHAASIARNIGVSRQSAHAYLKRFDLRGMLRWQDEPWIRSAWLSPEGQRIFDQASLEIMATRAAIERVGIDERWGILRAERAMRRELHRPPRNLGWTEHLLHPPLWFGPP
jgi:DNA-binding MarR family transcriptional regulator